MVEHIGSDEGRPLAAAVRAGDWLFVSGQASTDPLTGDFVAGTFEEEFARSSANLFRVLAEGGATVEQVVRVGAYVRDEDSLGLFNKLYVETFEHPRPARTTVAMGFGFLKIEFDAIAYLG